MIRAAARHLSVAWRREAAPLRPFLQRGLGVAQHASGLTHLGAEGGAHDRLRRRRAAVEERRADDRLADIAKDRPLLATAGLRLAPAEADVRPDAPEFGDLGAGFLAHQRRQPAREFALAVAGKILVNHMRDGEAEHAVAQKLQPLIGVLSLRRGADMGQRPAQQLLVGEDMADLRLERGEIGLRPRRHGAPAQCAGLNRRSQRTDQGQRQKASADSSFFTEKKMISARPTRLTKGT